VVCRDWLGGGDFLTVNFQLRRLACSRPDNKMEVECGQVLDRRQPRHVEIWAERRGRRTMGRYLNSARRLEGDPAPRPGDAQGCGAKTAANAARLAMRAHAVIEIIAGWPQARSD